MAINYQLNTVAITAALALLLGCGQAAETPLATPDHPAATAPNGSWVALSGTVVAAGDDSFVLDYGRGAITVELDDWDAYPEARPLIMDDHVVVYGYIDHDFFEQRTIEASSVYIFDLGTQIFANGADEEDFPTVWSVYSTPLIEMSGTVTAVSQDEFQLDTGAGVVDVNVEQMLYDPLDDEGFQRVDAGDRVRVRGTLGYDLMTDLDLMAQTVVSLGRGSDEATQQEDEG